MPIARASSFSLHLFSMISSAYLISAFLSLSHSLFFLSLPLNAFLYLVPPRRRPIVRETVRILGKSARYARCCGRDYPRCGLSKPPGRHPARIPLTKAFAYRIFNLRPGDALAASHSRRERGNVRTRAASRTPDDLTRSTFVLTSERLSGRLSVRDARARDSTFFHYRFIRATNQ